MTICSTLVYIGSQLCPVIEYRSTDTQVCRYKLVVIRIDICTQLVCISPPVPTDVTVIIKVSISAVDIEAYANCIGSCTFYYQSGYTPYLYFVSPGSFMNFPMTINGALRGTIAVCRLFVRGRT